MKLEKGLTQNYQSEQIIGKLSAWLLYADFHFLPLHNENRNNSYAHFQPFHPEIYLTACLKSFPVFKRLIRLFLN